MGEDGQLQELFEQNNIPYISPQAPACKIAFNKFYTNQFLKENGFFTLPSILIKNKDKNQKQKIEDFWLSTAILPTLAD